MFGVSLVYIVSSKTGRVVSYIVRPLFPKQTNALSTQIPASSEAAWIGVVSHLILSLLHTVRRVPANLPYKEAKLKSKTEHVNQVW